MAQQTAVEWLSSKLSITFQTMYIEEIDQAKAMEKEQIESAYDCGFFGHVIDGKPCTSGGKYYNETYNK